MEKLEALLARLSHLDLKGQISDLQKVRAKSGNSDVFTGVRHGRDGAQVKVAVKQLREFTVVNGQEDVLVKVCFDALSCLMLKLPATYIPTA